MSDSALDTSIGFGDLKGKDRRLLEATALATYTPEGGTAQLFGGAGTKLLNRVRKRGLEEFLPDMVETDIPAFSKSFAKLKDRSKSGVNSRIREAIEFADKLSERENREELVSLAKDALDAFIENKDYETLLQNLEDMPATLSDEDINFLKRNAIQQARNDEVGRLRRIRAASGISGMGGGSLAARAERAAADADRQISSAFNELALKKLEQDREDMQEYILMKSAVLKQRQNALSQLQGNLAAAISGEYVNVTQPLDEWSAFYEAQKALAEAQKAAAKQRRTDFYSGLIETGGELIGQGAALLTSGTTGIPSGGGSDVGAKPIDPWQGVGP